MIRQRGATWEVRVYVGRDAQGRKRQLHRTAPTEAAAVKLERKLQVEVDDGKHAITNTATTLGELVDQSLDLAATDLSPKTLKEYRGHVRRHLAPITDLPLRQVTAHRLSRLYDDLRASGLSGATVGQVHAIVARSCADGLRWGWLTSNPAAGARKPRVLSPDPVLPDDGALARMVDKLWVEDPDFAMVVWLAAATGMRRGELCALRWSDLEGARLHVRRAVVAVQGKLVEKDTKTRARRVVGLDAETMRFLGEHEARVTERACMCSARLFDDAFIFSATVDASRPLYPDTISSRYRRVADQHGVAGRFHDLRHWHVTTILRAGRDPLEVAARVGHASTKMTLDTYGHVLAGRDQAAGEVAATALQADTSI